MSSQLKTARRAKEPPSRPSPDALRFVITRDASDKWIVMETHGLYGGVFISRDAAVHFADLECRDREATFEVVTGRIERLERRWRASHAGSLRQFPLLGGAGIARHPLRIGLVA